MSFALLIDVLFLVFDKYPLYNYIGELYMNNKLSRKERRNFVLTIIICVTIIMLSLVSSVGNIMDIYNLKMEKNKLTKKLDDLKDEEKTLSDDVEKLKNPEYAARYAREKYLYSKTGEKVLKIN